MATRHNFHMPIRTESSLREFISISFGVTIPDTKICEDHTTPWAAFCDAYFARSPVSVWKASRGFGGKSYLLALLGLVEAATLGADVNVLGASGEQSGRVLTHMQSFWNYRNAPRQLLTSTVNRETRMTNGSRVAALMASQASVRGPHPQRLRMDEIDEMRVDILDAALGQPMSSNNIPAQTVMSSTHQYGDGTMTNILKRASERGWPVHQWCWRETSNPGDGWLSQDEIERKRAEVPVAMWNAEYDLQEPSPGDRAIRTDSIDAMFNVELGQFDGMNREYIEIEPPDPLGKYSTGADWARKQDFTIIVTLRTDIRPMKVVAFERRGREPWPVMIDRFDKRIERYGRPASHDGTGIGDVVAGMMKSNAESIIMAGRSRSDMLSEYIAAVENNEIVSPMIKFMDGEHRYASVDDVYSSGDSHHLPDTVSAMALAYHAADKKTFIPTNPTQPKNRTAGARYL
jgi:hypothetical protein